MKRWLPVLSLLSILAVAALLSGRAPHAAGTPVPKQLLAGNAENEAADQGPDNRYAAARELSDGRVGLHAFRRALDERAALVRRTAAAAPDLAAQAWTFDGPKSVGGRVIDISADPQQPNTVYVASAGGGVWTSTDAAGHFAS